MTEELKRIKHLYGEEMMHLCRELFPSILEKEGLLLSILESNLAHTHSFADDIINYSLYDEFKSWIYSFIQKKEKEEVELNKTPFELLSEAGYNLYECKTEEDIQEFRKYYKKEEELCTFRGGRLSRCHVFFAVKKDVENIKRENFGKPDRQDRYGTSVISIQFTKGSLNDVSIKNRYNHTVDNPDSTFSNNLDNIIPGLSKSFEKYYKFNLDKERDRTSDFLTRDLKYVKALDGKYYRYNIEDDARYFCENNIIIEDGKVIDYYTHDKARYLVIENFLIDRKEKIVKSLNRKTDAFIKSINDVGLIKNIDVIKEDDIRNIIINYMDNKQVLIRINNTNEIVEYRNNYVKEIERLFLYNNTELERLYLPNVEVVRDHFCFNAKMLYDLDLTKVKKIESSFLFYNSYLRSISLPNVEEIDSYFLNKNTDLGKINLPKVRTIGEHFLQNNMALKEIDFPLLNTIDSSFICNNTKIEKVNLPNLIRVGSSFLLSNTKLKSISLPNLCVADSNFLINNEIISEVNLPNLMVVGRSFMHDNEALEYIDLPKIRQIGEHFLSNNNKIEEINFPRLMILDNYFLNKSTNIREINIPRVKYIGVLQSNIVKELLPDSSRLKRQKTNYSKKYTKIRK